MLCSWSVAFTGWKREKASQKAGRETESGRARQRTSRSRAAVVRTPPWAAGHGPSGDLRPAESDQKGEEAAVFVLGING